MTNINLNLNDFENEINLPITLTMTPLSISRNITSDTLINNVNDDKTEENKITELLLKSLHLDSILTIKPKEFVEQPSVSKYIYNLKRSSNIPTHMKMPIETEEKAVIKLPNICNIMTSNNIYSNIPIYDQGNLGSCVSNALSFVYSLIQYKQNNKLHINPSRLFIYYNGRVIENTVNQDDGLVIYDGIIALKTNGVCDEILHPYNVGNFKTKPSILCYKKAILERILNVTPVAQTLNAIQTTLSLGFPIVIGIDVFSSFENLSVENTGIIPIPNIHMETLLGGHCIVLTGYDNTKSMFTFRNSWGIDWGNKGYGYIPYAYVLNPNIAFDFYVVRTITNPSAI